MSLPHSQGCNNHPYLYAYLFEGGGGLSYLYIAMGGGAYSYTSEAELNE